MFGEHRGNVLYMFALRDIVDKCVNRRENYPDIFALYPHTMPVSVLNRSLHSVGNESSVRPGSRRRSAGPTTMHVMSLSRRY
jgi:hypothetical protein